MIWEQFIFIICFFIIIILFDLLTKPSSLATVLSQLSAKNQVWETDKK